MPNLAIEKYCRADDIPAEKLPESWILSVFISFNVLNLIFFQVLYTLFSQVILLNNFYIQAAITGGNGTC
jgi:hypothetical protein